MLVKELATDRDSLAEQQHDKYDLCRKNMELEMSVQELRTDRNSLVEANEELNIQVHKLDDELELQAINARTDFAANNQYRELGALHLRNSELEAMVNHTTGEKLCLQSELHVLKQEVLHLQTPGARFQERGTNTATELGVAMAATQEGCQLVELLTRACVTDTSSQSLCQQLAKALSTADRALRQCQQVKSVAERLPHIGCPVVSSSESIRWGDQSYANKLGVSMEVAPGSQAPAPMAAVGVDTTGDGRANIVVVGEDRNRDGIPDELQ